MAKEYSKCHNTFYIIVKSSNMYHGQLPICPKELCITIISFTLNYFFAVFVTPQLLLSSSFFLLQMLIHNHLLDLKLMSLPLPLWSPPHLHPSPLFLTMFKLFDSFLRVMHFNSDFMGFNNIEIILGLPQEIQYVLISKTFHIIHNQDYNHFMINLY